jgi:hypothetical protein
VHRTTELEARQHRKHDNYFDKRRLPEKYSRVRSAYLFQRFR